MAVGRIFWTLLMDHCNGRYGVTDVSGVYILIAYTTKSGAQFHSQ